MSKRLEKLYEREEDLRKEIREHIELHDPEDGDEMQNLGKLLINLGKKLTRTQIAIDNAGGF